MSFGFGFGFPKRQALSGAAAAWTPAALGSDLALWLDAADAGTITLNGSTVSQWSDKSGNGRHVSQATAANQPTYAATGLLSKPTLRFNSPSAGRFLVSTASFPAMPTGVSAMVVAQVDEANNWNGYVSVGPLTAGVGAFEFYRQNNLTVGSPNSGNLVVVANRGNVNFKGRTNMDTAPTQGTPHIATAVISGASGLEAFMSINGGDNLPGPEHPSGTLLPQTTGIIRVGIGYLDPNQSASVMRGCISEIVMSASPWSTTDRQRLEGYLAWKWALEANLPAGHPFKNTPPTV